MAVPVKLRYGMYIPLFRKWRQLKRKVQDQIDIEMVKVKQYEKRLSA